MEKLNKVKNFHLVMGLLILLIQVIFQISIAVYFFGLFLVLFSFYEARMLKKLIFQRGEKEKTRAILTQFKWFNFFAIVPILLIVTKFMSDAMMYESISAFLFNRPLLSINFLIVSGVFMHWSMKLHLKEIEEEIISL